MSEQVQAASIKTTANMTPDDKNIKDPRKPAKKLDVQIPYVPSPGVIKTALDRIRQASTPERVSVDFVNTVLNLKGGNGGYVAPFLKKIGLVESDGRPSELYKQFRNPNQGGAAMASAIRIGYKALGGANEYFFKLDEKALTNLVVQVTGAEPGSSSVRQIVGSLKVLKEYADFDTDTVEATKSEAHLVRQDLSSTPPNSHQAQSASPVREQNLGVNLAYTINLNLPATTDQAVFNAIFKSLKEHLLSYAE